MKITKSFMLREIAGEYIIVPTKDTATVFNGFITVNEVGAFLWEQLHEETTAEALAQKVVDAYDIDYQTALKDVEDFLQILLEKEIL